MYVLKMDAQLCRLGQNKLNQHIIDKLMPLNLYQLLKWFGRIQIKQVIAHQWFFRLSFGYRKAVHLHQSKTHFAKKLTSLFMERSKPLADGSSVRFSRLGGSIAQRQRSRFSPSCPGFDSRCSRNFFSREKLNRYCRDLLTALLRDKCARKCPSNPSSAGCWQASTTKKIRARVSPGSFPVTEKDLKNLFQPKQSQQTSWNTGLSIVLTFFFSAFILAPKKGILKGQLLENYTSQFLLEKKSPKV